VKDDGVYLRHVLRRIARIEEYTAVGREGFFSSPLIQDGVIRNLQTLAESAQRLSESIKESYPEVDWKGLARSKRQSCCSRWRTSARRFTH